MLSDLKPLFQTLPALYSQEDKGFDAIAYLKFYSPRSGWICYATEFDGEDVFFGYVLGDFDEFGYFSLSEFEDANKHFQCPPAVCWVSNFQHRPLKDLVPAE
jgi:hypothetical protein